jgi:hypothetical protein
MDFELLQDGRDVMLDGFRGNVQSAGELRMGTGSQIQGGERAILGWLTDSPGEARASIVCGVKEPSAAGDLGANRGTPCAAS